MDPNRPFAWLRTVVTAIVGLTIFASATPSYAAELAGSEWRPTQIGDMKVSKEEDIFLRFEAEGKLKGHGGCNGFLGLACTRRTGPGEMRESG
jgi:heat shock protein HslJ